MTASKSSRLRLRYGQARVNVANSASSCHPSSPAATHAGQNWGYSLPVKLAPNDSPYPRQYRINRPVGPQTMVGEVGEARRDDLVFVHGELWRARPVDGEPLRPGQRVRVADVGPELTLLVEPVAE